MWGLKKWKYRFGGLRSKGGFYAEGFSSCDKKGGGGLDLRAFAFCTREQFRDTEKIGLVMQDRSLGIIEIWIRMLRALNFSS